MADLVGARWGTAPGTAAPWRFWSRWGLQRTACGGPRRFGVEHVKVHGILLVGGVGGVESRLQSVCAEPQQIAAKEKEPASPGGRPYHH